MRRICSREKLPGGKFERGSKVTRMAARAGLGGAVRNIESRTKAR